MKYSILTLLALIFGCQISAAETLKPDVFLTQCQNYAVTNSGLAIQLTVETNFLRFTSSDKDHRNSTTIGHWRTEKQWLVYMDKNLQAWAFDGAQNVWFLSAGSLGAKSCSAADAPVPMPKVVADRLPKAVLKSLKKTQ